MHECMIRLLKSSSDEESLECFSGLITTTGRDLDIPEAKVSPASLSVSDLRKQQRDSESVQKVHGVEAFLCCFFPECSEEMLSKCPCSLVSV